MVSLNFCAEFGRNQSKFAAAIVLTDTHEFEQIIFLGSEDPETNFKIVSLLYL